MLWRKSWVITAPCWTISIGSLVLRTELGKSWRVRTSAVVWPRTALFAIFFRSRTDTMVIFWLTFKATYCTSTLGSCWVMRLEKECSLSPLLLRWPKKCLMFWVVRVQAGSMISGPEWLLGLWLCKQMQKKSLSLLRWCWWVNQICLASLVDVSCCAL